MPQPRVPASLEKRFSALSGALGRPSAPADLPTEDGPAPGYLIVRASGADAARAVLSGARRADPDHLQLVMRAVLPSYLPEAGMSLRYPDCGVRAVPGRPGTVLLTVATSKLSIGFADLRPLLFQPVELDRPLQTLFAASVAHLLVVAETLDPHGIRPYLTGLAELVLRSALRAELDRADAIATRRRAAVEYMRTHLANPGLTAERIADALFISRRRLYQLFDDGDGVSGRLRVLRIDRAKELLGDPALAERGIGEISRQCGFANAAHFSRTFRKVAGEAPKEYRDRLLNR